LNNKPNVERLLSIGGTDFYLFYFPEKSETPAELSTDTLSLIKQKAKRYVVCADLLYLSHDYLKQIKMKFRKMPRDFGLLPEAVQAAISKIKPEYAVLWRRDMSLPERIELAKTCVHFDPRRSSAGNCDIQGYAPFDCPCCTSYIKTAPVEVAGSDEEES
jgi:hypothetical protein